MAFLFLRNKTHNYLPFFSNGVDNLVVIENLGSDTLAKQIKIPTFYERKLSNHNVDTKEIGQKIREIN